MKQSNTAKAQISALRRHFDDKNRLEASRNLTAAIRQTVRQIDAGKGWPAPRPYPELARPGRAWTHAGRYWFLYSTTQPPVLLGVFYEEADIPERLTSQRPAK